MRVYPPMFKYTYFGAYYPELILLISFFFSKEKRFTGTPMPHVKSASALRTWLVSNNKLLSVGADILESCGFEAYMHVVGKNEALQKK